MREEFLHFIWQYQLFDRSNLRTADGESVDVVKPGLLNRHAGPDFSDARIRIGDQLWAGRVEIHLDRSDWFAHNHHLDEAYKNVILHVVYDDVKQNAENSAPGIPLLNLKGRIDLLQYLKWRDMTGSNRRIPCHRQYPGIPEVVKMQNTHRLAVERLERKTQRVENLQAGLQGDREKTLLGMLCDALGAGVNTEPFRVLGRLIPLNTIKKLQGNNLSIEALVFGLAGFPASPPADDYMQALAETFGYLKHKFRLTPMEPAQWKFMRMRPANFPVMRIAQLAGILGRWEMFTRRIFYNAGAGSIEKILKHPPASYWKTHYRFGKSCKPKPARMGRVMVNNILINSIVPFLYAYGLTHGDAGKTENALALLQHLPPEKNHIITEWEKLGALPKNAFETQGLIELKNEYCTFKKCLSCKAGVWVLNQK